MSASERRREGVMLLHGFGSVPGTMWPLAQRLSRSGYKTTTPFYPSWRMGLGPVAARLQAALSEFADSVDGPVHLVGHSMGGLIIRALIRRHRPANLGKVVMLGTPNGGSEIADMFAQSRLRVVLGNAAPALVTRRDAELLALLGEVDYPAGIIAGNRAMIDGPWASMLPRPHDGKVSVAATHIEGEADHITLPITHALLPYHGEAQRQAEHFLRHGHFLR